MTTLEALLNLTQAQIAAQVDRASNVETQALGLIALDGALLALAGARASDLGGLFLWVAVGGLVLSIGGAMGVLRVEAFHLGPAPGAFYERYAALSSRDGLEQLLADLIVSFDRNLRPLELKLQRLYWALGILLVTVLVSVAGAAIYN
jgi:hypothetical protein